GILWDWRYQGRKEQQPPEGDWRTWLLLAGRGFGKSRTGAEYVRRQVEDRVCHRVALVAPTAADCRDVMVEGQSALGRGPTRRRDDDTKADQDHSRLAGRSDDGRHAWFEL